MYPGDRFSIHCHISCFTLVCVCVCVVCVSVQSFEHDVEVGGALIVLRYAIKKPCDPQSQRDGVDSVTTTCLGAWRVMSRTSREPIAENPARCWVERRKSRTTSVLRGARCTTTARERSTPPGELGEREDSQTGRQGQRKTERDRQTDQRISDSCKT